MTNKVKLSTKRIADLRCPEDKDQAFLIDADTPNLYVRIRPRGKPAFLFVGSMAGKAVNLVIGNTKTWTIPAAQEEARRMRTLIDRGIHPKLEREDREAETAKAIAEKSKVEITVGEVWEAYIARGVGKKGRPWAPTYLRSLKSAMHAGGEMFPRCGERRTVQGPLFVARDIPIGEFDDDALADILGDELDRIGERYRFEPGVNPPGYAVVNKAAESLSGMFRWASREREYKGLITGNPARSPTVQDNLPSKTGVRRLDFVELVQLEKFFEGLSKLPNRTMAGYLTGLLITGARRQELAALKWSDIDFDLKKLTIADKSTTTLHRTREIPLAPWLESVIRSMPKIDNNDYVFAAPRSKLGYVQDARKSLAPVLEHAKIKHLTPHGLRRTFSLVGEAARCPSGAIEQVMGHSVSSMEEHYKPRRIDALREELVRLEEFVREKARLPALALAEV
ncbi:MAG: tyrosine-type recombinase/integrase [bacterium]|nr:tyrosine-type recombinase/integrase [bacterium]